MMMYTNNCLIASTALINILSTSKVVYVGDGAAYVPVPSLKNRPLSPNLQALQTLQGLQGLTSGGTGVAGDEDWRRHPETWDREHRRYRPNTTRVQRECGHCFPTFILRRTRPTVVYTDLTMLSR